MQARIILFSAVLIGSAGWPNGYSLVIGQESPAQQADLPALIASLGAEEFAAREDARQAIVALGVTAFDELFKAQTNDDVEIQFSAKSLLKGIDIPWASGSDSDEARLIMQDFAAQISTEKITRMMRLKALPPADAVGVLCRIARYELDEKISKRAALTVMQIKLDAADPQDFAARIKNTIDQSPRAAAHWLHAYARLIQGDMAGWQVLDEQVQAELKHFATFPDSRFTDREIVHDLVRWQADQKLIQGDKQAAFEIFRGLLAFMTGTKEELLESVNWLAENDAWPLILEMQQRFPTTFASEPLLLYHLAAAHSRLDQSDQVDDLVQQAQSIRPEDARSHLVTAYQLQQRGFKDWAAAEYRISIQNSPVIDNLSLFARSSFAELLFDSGDAQQAAEVLKELTDAMQQDPAAREKVEKIYNRDPEAIISRRLYFLSQHLSKVGEREEMMKTLQEAIQHDPTDADVLIAMYHLPEPTPVWAEKTKQQIAAAVGRYRDDIRLGQQEVIEADNENERTDAKSKLATANNQFAWLVCNTFGDFDEAIRCSQKSLELRPDQSSYLDTLGHCYYAAGDFENAVKYQRMAVEIEPYSISIQNKLTLFEKALKSGNKE